MPVQRNFAGKQAAGEDWHDESERFSWENDASAELLVFLRKSYFVPQAFFVSIFSWEKAARELSLAEQDGLKAALDAHCRIYEIRADFLLNGRSLVFINFLDGREEAAGCEKLLLSISALLQKKTKSGVLAAYGNAYDTSEKIKASYGEARTALKILSYKKSSSSLLAFSSLGFERFLPVLETYSKEELEAYVRKNLGALGEQEIFSACPDSRPRSRKSKELGNAQLLQTLKAYLENNRSISATALALHVHRNTVYYRLERISELLDADLQNKESRVDNILAAIKIKEYLEGKEIEISCA